MPLDVDAIASEVVGLIAAAVAPLQTEMRALREKVLTLEVRSERLAAIEQRVAAVKDGEMGPAGVNGKDADPEQVVGLVSARMAAVIATEVERAVSALPPAQDGAQGAQGPQGEPGLNGKDGINGVDGKDGAPGLNGKDGADGLHGKDGINGVAGLAGKDGADGLRGSDGAPGADGRNGVDGLHGKDGANGVGVAGALIDREGHLLLTLSDGTLHKMGLVIGKDGAAGLNGKDGADGMGFDDMQWEYDGERTLTLKMVRGEREKKQIFTLPIPLYREVWNPTLTYEKGDAVTRSGSTWIAITAPTGAPGDPDSGWKLAVKTGTKGDRGQTGEKGVDGKHGKDGQSTVRFP
jgi:hypothetical protein